MTDIEKKVIENYNSDLLFNKQLDDYILGSLNTGASIKIGTTPYSLLLVNANKYDLVINQSVLKNSMNSEDIKIKHHSSGHNISLDFIKKLPEAIRNPLMIFKGRNNSIILITDFMDFKNRNIIIPIELNCQGYSNKVNKITSIYGRTNIERFIEKHLVEKNILAYNKNKTEELFYQIGQQLSNDEQIISYDNSISYTTENVKYPKERSEIMKDKIIENINFPEIVSHNEFIQSKPVKDIKQLENELLNEEPIHLEEKTPAKYIPQHMKENLDQELDKNKTYHIPQSSIVNIENELDSSSDNFLDILKQMADANDLHAKNMLALAYYFGDSGATKDVDKAMELFVEAAGEGSAVAQRNLAIICENTEPKDIAKAIEYYKMAINNENQPDAFALNNLGVCYLTGEGVENNPKKAVELFKKAAELGDNFAKLNLADAYYLGNGTRQSFKKAFELYKEVAETGDVTALKYLAECYQEGKGTEVNYKLALECYQKAAEKGDEHAKYKYTELSNKLNPNKHVEVDNTVAKTLENQIKANIAKKDAINQQDKAEQEKAAEITENNNNQEQEKAEKTKPEKARNNVPEL